MAMEQPIKVPKRILGTLLSALGAGVVPRSGAPYIAIGRSAEIEALLLDLTMVGDGGAACRFLIGRYGSGKSFLIQLIRDKALHLDFLTADADLSPERRLHGGSGAGLATYRELLTNLASKASPEGGALPVVLSRHYTKLKTELALRGILPEHPDFSKEMERGIYQTLASLEGDVGGFDFARVLGAYYRGVLAEDSEVKSACLRWLRGEFTTKSEAKQSLGFSVSTIIGDDNWYDFIKLMAHLSVQIGYRGLILFIDECVNLYKIPNRIAREANYEKILSIFNDTLQGKAAHLGVIFGGTPQFLEDPRRGLFSYDALKSRLADSRYAELGYQNLSSPVIRLRVLSDNELLALVRRLTRLYMQKEDMQTPPLSEEQILSFMNAALSRVGARDMMTPREIIRDYLTLLNILRDNPGADVAALIKALTRGADGTDGTDGGGEAPPQPKTTVNLFDIDI